MDWKKTQKDTLAFTGSVVRETQKAYLVKASALSGVVGDEKACGWLPKSQCLVTEGLVVIPAWLARRDVFCELAVEVETGYNAKAGLRTGSGA